MKLFPLIIDTLLLIDSVKGFQIIPQSYVQRFQQLSVWKIVITITYNNKTITTTLDRLKTKIKLTYDQGGHEKRVVDTLMEYFISLIRHQLVVQQIEKTKTWCNHLYSNMTKRRHTFWWIWTIELFSFLPR